MFVLVIKLFIKFASLVIIVRACSGGSRGYKFQKGESPPRLVQFYAVLYYFMGESLHRNLSGNCMLKNSIISNAHFMSLIVMKGDIALQGQIQGVSRWSGHPPPPLFKEDSVVVFSPM